MMISPSRGKEDLPPASLETQRHREDKTQDRECRGIFVREYPSQKFRDGFLESYHEKEEDLRLLLALSSVEGLLNVFLRETVAFILVARTRVNEINATLYFLLFSVMIIQRV